MERINQEIGCAYDDLDEAALSGAFENTNNELPDAWFEYPLARPR
jgi:hypothetical protein